MFTEKELRFIEEGLYGLKYQNITQQNEKWYVEMLDMDSWLRKGDNMMLDIMPIEKLIATLPREDFTDEELTLVLKGLTNSKARKCRENMATLKRSAEACGDEMHPDVMKLVESRDKEYDEIKEFHHKMSFFND